MIRADAAAERGGDYHPFSQFGFTEHIAAAILDLYRMGLTVSRHRKEVHSGSVHQGRFLLLPRARERGRKYL